MLIKNIKISLREQQILKAVIEGYISENVPIGSQVLKKRYNLDWSSATIRNAMSILEKHKLLIHTHTSSGRVPTDLGYRYYVDYLLNLSDACIDHIEIIENQLNQVSRNIDELLSVTASMLAKISHLFGVAMIISFEKSILNEVELVKLSSDRVMLIMGMQSGLIRSIVLNLKLTVENDDLLKVTEILKERLLGSSLKDIQRSFKERMKDTQLYDHEIIQILMNNPDKHFAIPDNKIVYTSSNKEILDLPENQYANNLHHTLEAIDEQNVAQYFKTYFNKAHNYLLIGNENLDSTYDQFSIITQVFEGTSFKGQIGVIGPTRIPYAQVLKLLTSFKEIMNRVC